MKSEIELYIIRKVKERRIQINISQRYLADCLNVSQSFIQQIEDENTSIAYNIDHLNAVAKMFYERFYPRCAYLICREIYSYTQSSFLILHRQV